jgi:hypothetical protein
VIYNQYVHRGQPALLVIVFFYGQKFVVELHELYFFYIPIQFCIHSPDTFSSDIHTFLLHEFKCSDFTRTIIGDRIHCSLWFHCGPNQGGFGLGPPT